MDVRLIPVNLKTDLNNLDTWLRQPHVTRWWGAAEENITNILQRDAGQSALIEVDGTPLGYICWQPLTSAEIAEADLSGSLEGIIDIDLFIGDPSKLGLGIGSRALAELLDRLKRDGVDRAGLAVHSVNFRALRAYEKVGFELHSHFREDGRDMQYLIIHLQ